MFIKEISSLQHPIVKHLMKLRADRPYRNEKQHALITGKNMVLQWTGKPIKTLLLSEEIALPEGLRAETTYRVPLSILKKITGLEHPDPFAAEVAMPKPSSLAHKKRLLALDRVRDPGNLGSLLRSAEAFGWEGVFMSANSVDPFNDKALRAAKGATFTIPLCYGSYEDLQSLIERNQLHVYLADAKGASLYDTAFQSPFILILGNEGAGIDEFFKKRFPLISIPMPGGAESLNVAAAGAIFLSYLSKPL